MTPPRTWGRHYTNTRNHRKISALRRKFPEYWAYVYVLLEMAYESNDEGRIFLTPDIPYSIDELKDEIHFHGSPESLQDMLFFMDALGMISYENGEPQWLSYNERQYVSDTDGAERVRKHREKAKSARSSIPPHHPTEETLPKHYGNVTHREGCNAPEHSRAEQKHSRADKETTPPPVGGSPCKARRSLSVNDLGKLWNETADPAFRRVILPFNNGRQKKFLPAIKEHPDPEWWKALFQKAGGVPFLKGENDRQWIADLEFVVRKRMEILEGKYGDGEPAWMRASLSNFSPTA